MSLPAPRLIRLPSGYLAYRRAGTGPPVVLIHGWGGSSRHWLGAFVTLSDEYDVIAIDLPGFGASPPPAMPARLRRLTAATLELIEALELSDIALGGHSLGAAVAMLAATARPELVNRLILTSFGLPRSPAEAELMSCLHVQLILSSMLWAPWLDLWGLWQTALRPLVQAVSVIPPVPHVLAGQVVHDIREVPYPALAVGAADLVAMHVRVGLEAATTTGDPTVISASCAVASPTLIIGGREDRIFPPDSARALASVLPRSGLVLFDRCGHVPMAEMPGPFYGTLGAFLRA
ncbi:MAG: alpha/beta fold hydrolase [Chloroflexaceae bacterium]